MDTAAIEAAGLDPIRRQLDLVEAVTGPADLLAALPELHRDGFLLLFGQAVTVDHDDSSVNLLWLVPTGLGLPDRDAYSDDSEAAVALREAYVAHVAAQLVNMGDDPEVAAAEAASILELETRLAEQQLKGEERRDPSNTLNRHTLDELEALTPGLPIRRPPGDPRARRRRLAQRAAAAVHGRAGRHPGRHRPRGAARRTPASTSSTRRPRRCPPPSTTSTSPSTAA